MMGLKCCICGEMMEEGESNNPDPITDENGWYFVEDAVCCDVCNTSKVVPARLDAMFNNKEK